MTTLNLTIRPDGSVTGLYSDALDFRALGAALGSLEIRRASHVEPTSDGRWTADMSPSGGGELGPFDTRAEALDAEVAWLRANVL